MADNFELINHLPGDRVTRATIEAAFFVCSKCFLNDGTSLTQNHRKCAIFLLHDFLCVPRPWDLSSGISSVPFQIRLVGEMGLKLPNRENLRKRVVHFYRVMPFYRLSSIVYRTTCRVWVGTLAFGGSVCSSSGSLARAIPLFRGGLEVWCFFCLRCESVTCEGNLRRASPNVCRPCGTESLVFVRGDNPLLKLGVWYRMTR